MPDFRHMLARADAGVRIDDSVASDRYCGSYRSADGVVFYVVQQEDGSLAIELPANWGAAESPLRADAAGGYFVVAAETVVRFENDADGRVTGLVASLANARNSITALKEPMRRGVVTIDDLPAELLRRAIVTIEDVDAEVPSVAVAAN